MTAPASRARPARRALDELSLPVDAGALEAVLATSPDWLASRSSCCVRRVGHAPG